MRTLETLTSWLTFGGFSKANLAQSLSSNFRESEFALIPSPFSSSEAFLIISLNIVIHYRHTSAQN